MRMLIRIVFVIFIAKGIECLGGVCDNCCDNCCDCFKEEIEEYEEIEEGINVTAESLVNSIWLSKKKNNPVLKIFKKKGDNAFSSKVNGDKILIKLDEKGNPKIANQNETENKFKLKDKKYALFEIKTKDENTVYLYCSDIESVDICGLFNGKPHVGISVIAYFCNCV